MGGEDETPAHFDLIPRSLITASQLVSEPRPTSDNEKSVCQKSAVLQSLSNDGIAGGHVIQSEAGSGVTRRRNVRVDRTQRPLPPEKIDFSVQLDGQLLADDCDAKETESLSSPETARIGVSEGPIPPSAVQSSDILPLQSRLVGDSTDVSSPSNQAPRVMVRQIRLAGTITFRLMVNAEYRGSYPSHAAAVQAAESILADCQLVANAGQEIVAIIDHRDGRAAGRNSYSFLVRRQDGSEEWLSYDRLKENDLLSEYMTCHQEIRLVRPVSDCSEVEFIAHTMPDSVKNRKRTVATSSSKPTRRKRCSAVGISAASSLANDGLSSRNDPKARGRAGRPSIPTSKPDTRPAMKGNHSANESSSDAEKRRELKRRRIEVEKELLRKELEILMLDMK